jgi:hypothetical protein
MPALLFTSRLHSPQVGMLSSFLKAFVFSPGDVLSAGFAGQVFVNDGAADHVCSDHIVVSGIAHMGPCFQDNVITPAPGAGRFCFEMIPVHAAVFSLQASRWQSRRFFTMSFTANPVFPDKKFSGCIAWMEEAGLKRVK